MCTDREPRDPTIKFAGGHFKVCLIDLKLPISRFKSIEAQKKSYTAHHQSPSFKIGHCKLHEYSGYRSLLVRKGDQNGQNICTHNSPTN